MAFKCGNDVCTRVGYFACIRSPLDTTGEDAFCLKCTENISKCATTEERVDCNLFCQELVRNQTLVEAFHTQTQLNATFTENTHDLEEELLKTWILSLVLGVLVACLLLALVVVLCRKRCKSSGNKDPEKADNDDDRPTGRAQPNDVEQNDEDETSRMIVATAPPERTSTGCQTNPEDNQMREMASGRDDPDERTSTGCQTNLQGNQIREMETCRDDPDGCPDATKSCQVHTQPTEDDDQQVTVDIAVSKPVGLSQCRVGEHQCRVGEHQCRVGEHQCRVGEHQCRVGEQVMFVPPVLVPC